MALSRAPWFYLFPLRWIGILLAVWVFALIFGRSISPIFGLFLFGLGLSVFYIPIKTVIHECGHLLVGWMVGFKVSMIQIGWTRWTRQWHGWERSTDWDIPEVRGLISMYPVKFKNFTLRNVLMTMGGVMAEVAIMSLAIIGMCFHAKRFAEPANHAHWLFGLEVGITISTLVSVPFNIIPRKAGNYPNDAMLIKSMITNKNHNRYTLMYYRVMAQAYEGVRLRDVEGLDFSGIDASKLHPWTRMGYYYFAYYLAADRGELPKASSALEQMLGLGQEWEYSGWQFVDLLQGWHKCYFEGETDAAQTILAEIPPGTPDQYGLIALVRAFVLAEEGKQQFASCQLSIAIKSLENQLDRGMTMIFLDSARTLRSKLEQMIDSSL